MSSVAYSIVETALANNLNVFDNLAKTKNNNVDNLRNSLPYSTELP